MPRRTTGTSAAAVNPDAAYETTTHVARVQTWLPAINHSTCMNAVAITQACPAFIIRLDRVKAHLPDAGAWQRCQGGRVKDEAIVDLDVAKLLVRWRSKGEGEVCRFEEK